MTRILGALALTLALVAAPALAQDPSLAALKAELAQGKQIVVARQMALNPEQEASFWPAYDEHQRELLELNRRHRENSAAYARAAASLDEDQAEELADEALEIAREQAQLTERTYSRLRRNIGPEKALQYLQLEAKFAAIANYDVAATLP
jgi:hypothetical protein